MSNIVSALVKVSDVKSDDTLHVTMAVHWDLLTITPEMEEIIHYLHNKDNYALFAGFAAFLLTGIEPSFDVDIFVSSCNDVKKIVNDFVKKRWTLQYSTDFMSTFEKNNTTFDIIFSETAKKAFLPGKVQVYVEGSSLYIISPEALLLTKLNQVFSLQRSAEKTKRDRKVIHILRQRIDVRELRMILQNIDDTFWTERYF